MTNARTHTTAQHLSQSTRFTNQRSISVALTCLPFGCRRCSLDGSIIEDTLQCTTGTQSKRNECAPTRVHRHSAAVWHECGRFYRSELYAKRAKYVCKRLGCRTYWRQSYRTATSPPSYRPRTCAFIHKDWYIHYMFEASA